MVDTTIAPANDRIVVHDGDNGHYRNQGPTWSAEPVFGQTANAVNVGDKAAHILNAMLTNFGFVREGIARVGSDTRDVGHQVEKSVCDARDATRQESGKLSKDICDARDASRQEGTTTRDRIQAEGRFNAEAFSNVRRELAGTESVLRKDLCDVRDAVRTEGAETRMELLKEACLTREVVKDRTDQLARQGIEHFGAIRLQAAENTARLSKELSDCCCRLEMSMAAAEQSRLKDALAEARLDLKFAGKGKSD